MCLLSACQTTRSMPTVDYVDMNKFMGDWYVIAHIPAWIERNAYNAVESYEMTGDGTIETTYRFNNGSFDGDQKIMRPKGWVVNEETNAEWVMQFIWPIKAEYLIIYLDEDYSKTIVGRSKRDYLWIMAREPKLTGSEYQELVTFAERQGYDISELRKVPQQVK
ncbi:MAG: lipocalin family protein [Gammaproteobacteria bacterium]